MRALVTGAAGFIGSHLCEQLQDEGHEVLAVDRRLVTSGDQIFPIRARSAWCADAREIVDLIADVDVVFHLAARPGVRQSWEDFDAYLQDNLALTRELLDAARGTKLQRFVYASSSSVYGDRGAPVSPYGVTKLAMEHLCGAYQAAHGVPTVGLRYFTVYGPRQRQDMAFARFIRAIRRGAPVEVLGDGLQARAFTYVGDAVRATIAAASAAPGIYDVAGAGGTHTVLESIDMLGEILDRKPLVQHLPAAAGDPRIVARDRHPARKLPGFTASTPLELGLQAQVLAS